MALGTSGKALPFKGKYPAANAGAGFEKRYAGALSTGRVSAMTRTGRPVPFSKSRKRSYTRLDHKLRLHGEPILKQMISNLQSVQERRMLWSLEIVELNKRISDILDFRMLPFSAGVRFSVSEFFGHDDGRICIVSKVADIFQKPGQGGYPAPYRKIVAAVFADAQPDSSIDTFAKMVVNEVIDRFGIEDICGTVLPQKLKSHGKRGKLKGGAFAPAEVFRHFDRKRIVFTAVIHIQNTRKEAACLLLDQL